MYQLEIKARATQMLQEAYEWYEGEQHGLGEIFLTSLDKVYQKISSHPEYFSVIEKQYRQVRLSRFPYVVVYE